MALANNNKKIVKNTLFLSVRMIIVLAITLYTSRVILNVMGVVDYGIYSVIAGFVSMFTFLNSSLSNAIQRFYNYELGKNGDIGVTRVFNTSMLIQVLLSVILFLLLETIGLWYLYNKMVLPAERLNVAFWLFQFSVLSTIFVVLQIPYSAAIMAYEKMDFYAGVSIFDAMYKLIFAIALPFIPADKLLMYGAFLLSGNIINFLIYLVYCKVRLSSIKRGSFRNLSLFKEMLSFSGWNFLGTFACIAREQGLNMILNLFFGPVVNAARGIAAQVYNAVQGFVNSVGIAVKPQLIQSYAYGDTKRTMFLMYGTSKLSFYILYIMALPIILEIDYILHLWLGDVVPEHTQFFVTFILLSTFINNLNANLSNIVHASGNMKAYQINFFITNLLILPCSYVAFRIGYSADAGFILYFLCTMFMQIMSVVVVRKIIEFSVKDYVIEVVFPLIVFSILSCVIPLVIKEILPAGLLRLFSVLVVSFVTSTCIFYIVGMNKSEKELCVSAIKSIKKKI